MLQMGGKSGSPQSAMQVCGSEAAQMPSPQTTTGAGQSLGQVENVSPPLHTPLPQIAI
jgi:hypothetical protein